MIMNMSRRMVKPFLLAIIFLLLLDFFVHKAFRYNHTVTGYLLTGSNPLPSSPILDTVFGATGVRFSGERYRPFDSPRLYKSFEPKEIKGKSEQSGKYPCTKWIVFTTVYSPSESVTKSKQIVDSKASWCCVVVFDKKTPADKYKQFKSNKYILLTVKDQIALAKNEPGYKILEHIPWNHFARKIVGYLYAIHQNAEVIFEMDDDNLLIHDDVPVARKQNGYSYVASTDHVYNPYKDFIKTDSSIWPRGLPLDFIQATNRIKVKSPGTPCKPSLDKDVSIQQFLANHDPDVDAIYRLTNKLPIYFDESKNKPIVLQTGTLSPFNAQATLYLASAFYGLFLPTTVNGRVSDIWRSYFTQRLQWDIGGNIAFTKPHVKQKRNSHDYLADFQSEIPIYSKTSALIKFLVHWKSTSETLEERMEELAIEFYQRGYWELSDVILIQKWIQDLHELGYEFPNIVQPDQKECSNLQNENISNPRKPEDKGNEQTGQISKRERMKNPKLQLFLRMFSNSYVVQLYNQILIPSLKLFWQQEVEPMDLILVLDDENPGDHTLGEKVRQMYPQPKVFYEPPPYFYQKKGHTRMQWGMFWADNYTDAEHVGFIDTDTMFSTLVTQDLLFDGNKPHIWGVFNKPTDTFWAKVPQGTYYLLKKKEVFRGMNYFPVIIKVQHLVQLRKYVESVHNKPFSLAWRDVTKHGDGFSQFNIIANYIWYFHRDDYIWHMEENGGPGYKGNVTGQTNDFSEITPQMRVPYPRSSVHHKYLKYLGDNTIKLDKNWNEWVLNKPTIATRNRLLREGYCFSAGFRKTPEKCKEFSENVIQQTLFDFEGHTWTWDKRCFTEQKKHYDRVKDEKHVWDEKTLEEIFES